MQKIVDIHGTGSATILLALLSTVILPDLPHNTRGFSEDELRVAQLRMIEDVGEADIDSKEVGAFAGLSMALRDIKIYLMMLITFLYVLGLTFNAFFVSLALCPVIEIKQRADLS
jgi:hypothetical protein